MDQQTRLENIRLLEHNTPSPPSLVHCDNLAKVSRVSHFTLGRGDFNAGRGANFSTTGF